MLWWNVQFKKRVVHFVENVAAMTHYVKTDFLLEALALSVNYKMLNVNIIKPQRVVLSIK